MRTLRNPATNILDTYKVWRQTVNLDSFRVADNTPMSGDLRPAPPCLEKVRLPVLNPAASLADVNYEFVKRKIAQSRPKPGTHWRQIKRSAVAGLENCHVWLETRRTESAPVSCGWRSAAEHFFRFVLS